MFSISKKSSTAQQVVLQELTEDQLSQVAGGCDIAKHQKHHAMHKHHKHHHKHHHKQQQPVQQNVVQTPTMPAQVTTKQPMHW